MNSIVSQDMESIAGHKLPWADLSGTRILITGAAGFLPAYMVETVLYLNRHVLTKPAQVFALIRNEERARLRFREALKNDDLQLIVQDVSQPLQSKQSFDFIIHAASQASPHFYWTDPVGTLAANVLGTRYLLEAARSGACRGFLYFSSGEIYGIVRDGGIPISETDGGFLDPSDVRSCYGESKRMGETMCVSWAQQYGVPARIVRPFHTYGPGMRLEDGRVFADFVRDILNGGPIVLHSDGRARRSFCYLADAVVGFFTVLLLGQTGQAYNVANPEGECSIAELAERLAAVYWRDGIRVERKVRTDSTYFPSPIVGTMPSIEKIKALGWIPRISIEEGFQRTVESYRKSGIVANHL